MNNYSALRRELHKLELQNVKKIREGNNCTSSLLMDYLGEYQDDLTKNLNKNFSSEDFQIEELLLANALIINNLNLFDEEKQFLNQAVVELTALKNIIRKLELQVSCSNKGISLIQCEIEKLYIKKQDFVDQVVELLYCVITRANSDLIAITVFSKSFLRSTDGVLSQNR